jgi:hypothetical protein
VWPASCNCTARNGLLHRPVRADTAFVDARVLPKLAGDLVWVDPARFPPAAFVTGTMHRSVMDPAERDREFIAGLAAERPRLHVSKVMQSDGLRPQTRHGC